MGRGSGNRQLKKDLIVWIRQGGSPREMNASMHGQSTYIVQKPSKLGRFEFGNHVGAK